MEIAVILEGGGTVMATGKYKEWLTEEGLLKIEGWAMDGLTDEQIAHNMGIHVATLYEYKKRYDEISEVLKRGKEVIDRQVENALLKRALGYQYDETTKEGGIVTKVVTKEVHPDTTAQIFWLKNRKRTEWRDKQDIEHSGEIKSTVDMSNLTVEELRKLAKLSD